MGSITTNKPSKFSKQSNTKLKQNWVLDICRVEKQIYDKEQKNKKKICCPKLSIPGPKTKCITDHWLGWGCWLMLATKTRQRCQNLTDQKLNYYHQPQPQPGSPTADLHRPATTAQPSRLSSTLSTISNLQKLSPQRFFLFKLSTNIELCSVFLFAFSIGFEMEIK